MKHLCFFLLFLQKNPMRNIETFRQYTWLLNIIQHAKKISYERIRDLWIENDMNDGKPLSRTTFYRLRQAIEDMFGICIDCDTSDNYQYYISNPEVLKDNSTQNWMLQTLTVNNVLIDSLSIKDRLVLEEIPVGMEYLQTIIKAIKNNHVLTVTYHKFNDPEGYTTYIEPYCLKVFHQRWYLLGNNTAKKKGLQIYALDRIKSLTETEQNFEIDSSFDASNFFKNYFGVFIGDDKTLIRIILRAYGKMIPLLRTLPKHHSQKEIATTEHYSDFEYHLVPTFDFIQEILKEGDELEVIYPVSLRKEIIKIIKSSLKRYRKILR